MLETTLAWVLLVPGFAALLFSEGDPTYRALAVVDPANGGSGPSRSVTSGGRAPAQWICGG